jgi:DNA-binding transcriptional regulator YhcF (GntR family)
MYKFQDGIPIYTQISGELKSRVISGQIKPGDKLPSVREIAEEFSVNPNTVQRVFMELEKDGFTYSERGVGTFLKEDGNMVAQLQQQEAEKIRTRFISEAKKLGLSLDKILKDLANHWEQGGTQE